MPLRLAGLRIAIAERAAAAARKAGDLFHSSSPRYEPSFSDFGKAASSGLAVGSFVGFGLHVLAWVFTIAATWFPNPITWAVFSGLAWLCVHAAGLFVQRGSRAITPAQLVDESATVAAEQATLRPPAPLP